MEPTDAREGKPCGREPTQPHRNSQKVLQREIIWRAGIFTFPSHAYWMIASKCLILYDNVIISRFQFNIVRRIPLKYLKEFLKHFNGMENSTEIQFITDQSKFIGKSSSLIT